MLAVVSSHQRKNYPAHKLKFLALKWAITEKLHDYLYGAKFSIVTDNDPLTYVFTTAKLHVTGQLRLAELSKNNSTISYRSGNRIWTQMDSLESS